MSFDKDLGLQVNQRRNQDPSSQTDSDPQSNQEVWSVHHRGRTWHGSRSLQKWWNWQRRWLTCRGETSHEWRGPCWEQSWDQWVNSGETTNPNWRQSSRLTRKERLTYYSFEDLHWSIQESFCQWRSTHEPIGKCPFLWRWIGQWDHECDHSQTTETCPLVKQNQSLS